MVNLMTENVALSLADRVRLRSAAPGVVELKCGTSTIRLKQLDTGVQAALCRLDDGPVTAGELEDVATTAEPEADLGRLAQELGRIAGKSFIRFSCTVDGDELLSATATGPLADFDFSPPPPMARVQLSRFAYAHRVGSTLVIDSPASHASVEINAPGIVALLAALSRPHTIKKLHGEAPGLRPDATQAAAGFLLGTGVLSVIRRSGQPEDESRPGPAQREFHDVAMHAASRRGLNSSPSGGTYRFHGLLPPAPAIRPLPDGKRTPLPRPDLERIISRDPPLGQVMESRRSIREFGADPITIEQLGEFLFRVARMKHVTGIDENAGLLYETSQRTSPSGGGCHDLEFYLTIRQCSGLSPGIYHYDPAGHQVTLVCARPDLMRAMILEARISAGRPGEPQVLITLASRFTRVSWKYQGIAYAITLKNTGVLYEAMYLAATAMGLAPCGIGCGNSATFSLATGLDPLTESSVGEFILGTRAE